MMTLYLLFEELDAKRLTLKSPLSVSANAARQPPSKLGLHAGSTIAVEDAILALVTKSANDVAVVVAENVGGNVDDFAARMTRTAHALGMSNTTFRNPNGLPDSDQTTTAHDLVRARPGAAGPLPDLLRLFRQGELHLSGRPPPQPQPPARLGRRRRRHQDRLHAAPPASTSSPTSSATAATSSPWSWAAKPPRAATRICAS